ncbi:helix-turn-helix domain-containing protein [Pseudoroseomonas cervicalis]|uniref:helix-turn-helix domain-containing protein n=1 Tax=Teichococcus cervicalis TaxID=204525 RepID=UPI0022F1CBB9|nr:helix-turn-helix domain-containing protein [Pseudoroseomonas cervicalis]WBV42243.1 helix-turn-helix domain-containing protein [Pseudoroseomonas cervicalis]
MRQIGARLRAWRLGAGLAPDLVAARLGISRAALYTYEKDGIPRLDLLERAAGLLGISLAALIGIEVEHFPSGAGFFERMRQAEAEAEQILACFDPISILLASPAYPARLRLMLEEATSGDPEAAAGAARALAVLEERRAQHAARPRPLTALIALPRLAQLLRTGLTGRDDLPDTLRAERRAWAREEIAAIVQRLEAPPIGVQIGLLEAVPPSQTFEVLLGGGPDRVAVSPFRLGEYPNVTAGIATLSAEPATVALYRDLAQRLWQGALKGEAAAQRLRALLAG